MADSVIVASHAITAFGEGEQAFGGVTELGTPARVALGTSELLSDAGLRRPFAGVAPVSTSASEDRATALLTRCLRGALDKMDATSPAWRTRRIGVAIGTSSGGMLSFEQVLRKRRAGEPVDPLLGRRATYAAPFEDALAAVGLGPEVLSRRVHVLTACAASTLAIGLGHRWLEQGVCDVVIAAGYDALAVFVAAGFEALRATTASRPNPFRVGRDGMSVGEGAGVTILVRPDDPAAVATEACVVGFGASTDAVHITAPDRTGGGLARAASQALRDAEVGVADIGIVSAHATATPFNDPMEAKAIGQALALSQRQQLSEGPVVHPFKAQIGHTLGAAGVVELLALARCLKAGVAPAAAGSGELDPEASVRLLSQAEPLQRSRTAGLKLSAAFGGANAALVVTTEPRFSSPRSTQPVRVAAAVRAPTPDMDKLAASTGIARDRLGRLDGIARWCLAAVNELATACGGPTSLSEAGIVVGHTLATMETNARFFARALDKGAARVEPRLFPATSPHAAAGECAIAFGLRGPGLAVAGGLEGAVEALEVAATLVAAGDAERMVVVAGDEGGPAADAWASEVGCVSPASGAVAALLVRGDGPGSALDIDGLARTRLARRATRAGHESLAALLGLT